MKYFSEKTNKVYDTIEALDAAEKDAAAKEKAAEEAKAKAAKAEAERRCERAAAAKKVSESFKAYLDAENTYKANLADFCKKYGPYHMTLSDAGKDVPDILDAFSSIFRF